MRELLEELRRLDDQAYVEVCEEISLRVAQLRDRKAEEKQAPAIPVKDFHDTP